MKDLDAALLAAHAAGDHRRLVTLYSEASEATQGDAAAFFLTQAWVFALQTGDPRQAPLKAALKQQGRA